MEKNIGYIKKENLLFKLDKAIYTVITKNLGAKKIYLSLTKDEIHLAVVPKVRIRKQYNLSINKMNQLYTAFLDEIKVIDDLVGSKDY